MKILKTFLFVLIALVVIALVIGFFMPSHMQVDRAIEINAPVDKVFAQINDLKNWEQWSPWHQMDKKMKIDYAAQSSGTGAFYVWNSNNKNVGSGKLTITESVPNEFVKTAMDFGDKGSGSAVFKFEKLSTGTKVNWSMESDMGNNPFMKLLGPMMETMIGKSFEEGLGSLKSLCEK